jgi:hypothetical protein
MSNMMTPNERAETIVFQLDQYLGAVLNSSAHAKTARGFLVLALTYALEETRAEQAQVVPTISSGDNQGEKSQ